MARQYSDVRALGFNLPLPLYKRLESEALRLGVTKTFIIQSVLYHHFFYVDSGSKVDVN